jgi:hypothetical protein
MPHWKPPAGAATCPRTRESEKTVNNEIADAAARMGEEIADTACDAFVAMCHRNGEPPPTKRERILIRVFSLQLASALATVIEDQSQ